MKNLLRVEFITSIKNGSPEVINREGRQLRVDGLNRGFGKGEGTKPVIRLSGGLVFDLIQIDQIQLGTA